MEDLREVGQKAIESVGNLGASNAGDLVLGIGEIIEDLRKEPEQYQEKLDHLEGLFREFAFGEGYELRNDRTKPPEDEDVTIAPNAISGYVNSIPVSGQILGSGVLQSFSMGSSVAGTPPTKPPIDPSNPSSTIHPYGEIPSSEEEDLLLDEKEIEELKPEKCYKHKWWKKKV